MLKVLYGNLKIQNKFDFLILPFKILYMVYTLPFLIFALLSYIRTLGAFGNPVKEKFGVVKKILLHFSAIFLSFIFWGVIINIINGKYR